MIVVDTNIISYFYLNSDYSRPPTGKNEHFLYFIQKQ